MKPIKNIFLLAITIIVGNCSKNFLDKDPLGYLDEANLANKSGLEKLLIGAYSMLDGIGGNKSGFGSAASNWIYGSICGTEAYKGTQLTDAPEVTEIETFTATADNLFFANKWGAVYDGIQRANDVLRVMAKATDLELKDQQRIAAEARFLRAHYHFEAKKMWDKVPFIDETITYANGNYHVSNHERDIWPDIVNDLKHAMDNLESDSYSGAVGRANKYTAMALLAKAYMFQDSFHQAKPLLERIISSAKYELRSYHENFNPETRNGNEAIFTIQMSVNDGAPDGENGNYGDQMNFPWNGGPAGCCGFFQPSQYLVNHFKTDPITGLPDLEHFNDADVYNDEGFESSDPSFIPYGGSLDPRLDWTIGRRGIPYLDWGDHPGKAWIRDQSYGGPYAPKKNVYYKRHEQDLSGTNSWGGKGITANNVKVIRLADVILWAAEVEVAIGDLNIAREYVNLVRRRAGKPANWVKRADGTNAAEYKVGEYTIPWTDRDSARKAVRFERALELAMEGHRFFDLVRWKIANEEISYYLRTEQIKRYHLTGALFRPNCNEYFPIPQLQIDLSAGADGIPKMKQNPCYP